VGRESRITSREGVTKNAMKATYICRSPKKKALTFSLFFYLFIGYRGFLSRFLGRFVTRRVQKHDELFFQKIRLGSSQKMRLFFPPFLFSPPVVLLAFFCRFFLF
jgi:hypothetical protein